MLPQNLSSEWEFLGKSVCLSPHCCYATTENPVEERHLYSSLSVLGVFFFCFFFNFSTHCVEFLNTLSIVRKLQEKIHSIEK